MNSNATLPDPTAVSGRRVVAHVIDVLVIALLWLVVYALTSVDPFPDLSAAVRQEDGTLIYEDQVIEETDDAYIVDGVSYDFDLPTVHIGGEYYVLTVPEALPFLVGTMWFILIFVVFGGLTGATTGKALTGIRAVQTTTGNNPGLLRGFVRAILLPVDMLLLGIGYILALFTKGHRRLGDRAAGTVVVTRSARGYPIDLSGDTPRAGEPAERRALPLWEPDAQAQPTESTPLPTRVPHGADATTEQAVPQYWAPDQGGTPAEPTPVPSSAAPNDPAQTPTAAFPTFPGVQPDQAQAASTPFAQQPAAEPAPAPQATPGPAWPGSTGEPTPASNGSDHGAGAAQPMPAEIGRSAATPATADPSAAGAASGGAATAGAAAAGVALDSPYTPQWDAARNAYICWDAHRQEWLQFDYAANTWGPISR